MGRRIGLLLIGLTCVLAVGFSTGEQAVSAQEGAEKTVVAADLISLIDRNERGTK